MPNINVSFISNNVKEIQTSKKRLKLIQYFKDKIGSTGVLFLQEIHCSSKVYVKNRHIGESGRLLRDVIDMA